jgi:hypothetical protein
VIAIRRQPASANAFATAAPIPWEWLVGLGLNSRRGGYGRDEKVSWEWGVAPVPAAPVTIATPGTSVPILVPGIISNHGSIINSKMEKVFFSY